MNNVNNKINRFSIRKFSIGVASALVGFVFLGNPVSADEVSKNTLVTQSDLQIEQVQLFAENEQQTSESGLNREDKVEPIQEQSSDVKMNGISEDRLVKETKDEFEKTDSLPSENIGTVNSDNKIEILVNKNANASTVQDNKKTVGYAASTIDTPETSIVNDVTRVRAIKSDGKYNVSDASVVSREGRDSLLATGTSGLIGDDYPWKNANPDYEVDSLGYPVRQCTAFVAYRLYKTNGFTNVKYLGNAGDWGNTAVSRGARVDHTPAVGSVAWFKPGDGWSHPVYGHVSWVAAVHGDKVLLEEYNRTTPLGYGTYEMPINMVTGFIHFKDLTTNSASTSPTKPINRPNQGTATNGVYHFSGRTSIKAEPKMSSPDLAYYDAGQSVNYDRKLEADGHEWISYISFSGNRRYIPIKEISKPTPTVLNGTIYVNNMNFVNGSFDVIISNISSNKGLKEVKVPIWSDNNGQDDIVWYNANRQNDGTYKTTVQISRHKNDRGKYNIHLYYVTDEGQKYVTATSTVVRNVPSTNKERKLSGTIKIENKRVGEFDIVVTNVYSPKGVKEVKLPTWSHVDGQDDIIWYTPTLQADGTYRQHVNAKDHKNSNGEYSIHLYYSQNDGTLQGVGGTTTTVETVSSTPNIPTSGVYTFSSRGSIKAEPKISSPELAFYNVGNTVSYDQVLNSDGHTWISYIGFSGNRRYIAIN